MRLVGKTPNKALKTDAIDSAPVAHGFAILCTTGAPLLRRLAWRVCRAWHLTSEVQVLVPGIRRAEG